MKTLYSILVAALFLTIAAPSTRAEIEVSVDFFHENLEPYGDWREVDDYGYCWQPRDVDADWSPYSDGRWVYTDAGWTWDSDEPYSWAVYHYGRWARIDEVGWVWAPGTEWGPAWVSWRRGSRHVGWAPLPPEARFSRSSGFSARVDVDFDIGPGNYSFVEVSNFGAPRLRAVFIEPRENITIINQTTNITNITYVNSVVYNGGPEYDVISRESTQPVRRLKLDRREQVEGGLRTANAEQLRSRVDGDTLRVVAPAIDAKAATAPRKLVTKVEKGKVNRGWKNAGHSEEVEKVRNKIKSEPTASIDQPPKPKEEKTETPSVLSPEMNENRAKGRNRDGDKAPRPSNPSKTDSAPAGSHEAAPATGKPQKTGKSENGRKSKKPLIDPPVTPPVVTQKVEEPEQPKKTGKNKRETQQNSVKAAPEAKAPPLVKVQKRKAKNEVAEPARKQQPVVENKAREKARPEKEAVRPQTEARAERNIPRETQNKPESRQEARKPEPQQQAATVVKQSKPAQSEKAKGKAKSKNGGKDGDKTEEATQ